MTAKLAVIAHKDTAEFMKRVDALGEKLKKDKRFVIGRGASVKGDKYVAFIWHEEWKQ